MIRLFIILSLIFSISLSKQLNAQVTIGSGQKPAPGALLDLKEESSTTKGLALPRVKLIDLKPISLSEFAASIGGSEEWEMDKHIGLTVYNVIEGTGKCVAENYSLEGVPWKGVHVWNGEAWLKIPKNTKNIETDVRTLVYHGIYNIEGVVVGSFTMSYEDEEETYYYADYKEAGIWMTQNLRTQYTPQGIKLEMISSQTNTGKDNADKRQYRGAYPSPLNDKNNPLYYRKMRSDYYMIGTQRLITIIATQAIRLK